MSTDATSDGEPLPREPDAYRPAIHFGQRFKDIYDEYNRHLDGEIVEGCIKRGVATEARSGVYYLRETFGGVTYRLVVDVGKGEVVTGHPISINTQAATRSDRWSSSQITDIHEFITSKK